MSIVPLNCSMGNVSLARVSERLRSGMFGEVRGLRDHSPWERNPGLSYTRIHRDMDTLRIADDFASSGSLLCRCVGREVLISFIHSCYQIS